MRLSLPRLKMPQWRLPRLPGMFILRLAVCGVERLGDGLAAER
ncbi:Uncharacterised protein [Raoultella planticola]|uniref:Uncharacterized protein n=1 Tax=Raoultella planticola TaxID=575 RepID=A0A485AYQ4_RAOPL|nr:Uncharacterised protein [Raoultella planticola]